MELTITNGQQEITAKDVAVVRKPLSLSTPSVERSVTVRTASPSAAKASTAKAKTGGHKS